MTTKVKEIIALAAIIIFALVFYIGKVSGWGPSEFSMPVTIVVIGLLLVSLLWILVLTIR